MHDDCPYCNGTGKLQATFASRLVSLRAAKGVTQQDVANFCHLSRPQIANLEIGRGEASVTTLLSLANYFEVSTDYLLGRAAPSATEIPEGDPARASLSGPHSAGTLGARTL